MKVTVLTSAKGGVGRTTIALNLAYALASKGYRTVLVDADPQAGMSASLGAKVDFANGLAELIRVGLSVEEVLIPTRLPTLKLLSRGQLDFGESSSFSSAIRDGKLLQEVKERLSPHFDFMLIDTPSGMTGVTEGALLVADSFLSPIAAEPLSLRSVPRMLEAIHWLHSQRVPFDWGGFVLNMWSPSDPLTVRIAQDIFTQFPTGSVWKTLLPTNDSVKEASAAATPLALFSQHLNPMVSTFQELANEFESKWNPKAQEIHDEPLSLVG